jgi:hypothetical protein
MKNPLLPAEFCNRHNRLQNSVEGRSQSGARCDGQNAKYNGAPNFRVIIDVIHDVVHGVFSLLVDCCERLTGRMICRRLPRKTGRVPLHKTNF